jgi:hypothetical protein
VNVLAYKADFVAATEELKLLERAARAEHCSSPENWSSSSAISLRGFGRLALRQFVCERAEGRVQARALRRAQSS